MNQRMIVYPGISVLQSYGGSFLIRDKDAQLLLVDVNPVKTPNLLLLNLEPKTKSVSDTEEPN